MAVNPSSENGSDSSENGSDSGGNNEFENCTITIGGTARINAAM